MQARSVVRRAAALVTIAVAGSAGASAARAAEPPAPLRVVAGKASAAGRHSVQPLTFTVRGGPNGLTCPVEAELYRPAGATAAAPVPAIITTNGFGGNVAGQRKFSRSFADRGYAVLNYSGLGWGKSGCKIALDDPDRDGLAARQLVSYLGGARTPGQATPIDWVRRDAKGHDGVAYAHDPRVGTFGGSYGGGFQFAAAKDDPRIDTLVPLITWNDLRYSLSPDNGDLGDGVTPRSAGSLKTLWSVGFFALGLVNGAQGIPVDLLGRTLVCPGFVEAICAGAVLTVAQGSVTSGLAETLQRSSVSSYVDRIRVPVLLGQGQADNLFNLNESLATYRALRRQGTPVKLIWHSWGHNHGRARPGEWDEAYRSPTYEGTAFLEWFDHYLKDDPKAPSLDFTYFRDWVPYGGDASPAYARSEAYPAAPATEDVQLSGDGRLTADPARVTAGAPTLTTTLLGLPTGTTSVDLVQEESSNSNIPGTFVSFTGDPLPADRDVVGVPTVDLRIDPGLGALTGPLVGDPGQSTVYVRLDDVAPGGGSTLPGNQVSAVKVPVDGRSVRVSLPGIVHRFRAGHRLRLVVAGGDVNYRGSVLPTPLSIRIDPRSPSTLRLPVVPAAAQGPIVRAAVPAGAPAPATRPRAPRATAVRLTRRRVSARLAGAARVRATVERRVGRRWKAVRTATVTVRRAGRATVRLRRALPAGRYRVRLRVTRSGTRARTVTTKALRLG
jgi:ABC-2 type transport system ATP-binding protein